VTAARIATVVVLLASGAVVFYGLLLDRSGQNVAFTVAGLAVMGGTLAFVAAWFLGRALAAARQGHGAPSLTGAVLGGLCAIGSAGCLAAASVFAILTRLT
jgi:hypothetical protein